MFKLWEYKIEQETAFVKYIFIQTYQQTIVMLSGLS